MTNINSLLEKLNFKIINENINLTIYKLHTECIIMYVNFHFPFNENNYININSIKPNNIFKYYGYLEEEELIKFIKETFKQELRKQKIETLFLL